MLAKVEKLPNRKALLEDPAATMAIDVSEEPIECPVKNQNAYYSGEKTPNGQGPARNLRVDVGYLAGISESATVCNSLL